MILLRTLLCALLFCGGFCVYSQDSAVSRKVIDASVSSQVFLNYEETEKLFKGTIPELELRIMQPDEKIVAVKFKNASVLVPAENDRIESIKSVGFSQKALYRYTFKYAGDTLKISNEVPSAKYEIEEFHTDRKRIFYNLPAHERFEIPADYGMLEVVSGKTGLVFQYEMTKNDIAFKREHPALWEKVFFTIQTSRGDIILTQIKDMENSSFSRNKTKMFLDADFKPHVSQDGSLLLRYSLLKNQKDYLDEMMLCARFINKNRTEIFRFYKDIALKYELKKTNAVRSEQKKNELSSKSLMAKNSGRSSSTFSAKKSSSSARYSDDDHAPRSSRLSKTSDSLPMNIDSFYLERGSFIKDLHRRYGGDLYSLFPRYPLNYFLCTPEIRKNVETEFPSLLKSQKGDMLKLPDLESGRYRRTELEQKMGLMGKSLISDLVSEKASIYIMGRKESGPIKRVGIIERIEL